MKKHDLTPNAGDRLGPLPIWLLAGAIGALAVAGCSRVAAPAPASAAAMRDVPFRLDYARTGYDGGPAPAGLRAAWTWKKEPYRLASSPMVRDGRVYVSGFYPDLNGTFGLLACVNATDGSNIWEATELDGRDLRGIFSSPVLSADGKRLVVGEGMQWDTDCRIYCLDAATGKLIWSHEAGAHHVWNTPAIAGDMVLVGVGTVERNDHQPVPATGYLLALRLSDGQELWRCDIQDPEGAAAIAAGVAYVPSDINSELVSAVGYAKAMAEGDDYQPSAQSLYAVSLDDVADLQPRGRQRVLWRTLMPYPAGGAVALSDAMAIVGTGEGYFGFFWDDPGGAVVAVDRATGTVRWRADVGSAVWGPVAVRNGRAYCPLRNGFLAALDARDGKELWRQRLAEGEEPDDVEAITDTLHAVHAGPAVTDTRVYAVSAQGRLFVLDAADGTVQETHDLNDPRSPDELAGWCVSSPMIVAGRLYVGSETGGLHCFVGSDR